MPELLSFHEGSGITRVEYGDQPFWLFFSQRSDCWVINSRRGLVMDNFKSEDAAWDWLKEYLGVEDDDAPSAA